jgi:hypothetical protein
MLTTYTEANYKKGPVIIELSHMQLCSATFGTVRTETPFNTLQPKAKEIPLKPSAVTLRIIFFRF